MKEEILSICQKNQVLLDSEVLSFLLTLNSKESLELLRGLLQTHKKIITKKELCFHLGKIKNKEEIEDLEKDFSFLKNKSIKKNDKISQSSSLESEKKRIKIWYSLSNISKKFTPQDFTVYFRNRFKEMKKFLQDRKELLNLTSINKIGGKKESFSIIGIVFDKKITKNKNIILEVEDLTGRLKVLVSKEKEELYNQTKEILLDEVIGIRGFGNQEILFVNDLFYPEAFLNEKKTLSLDENIAVISDLHLGSKKFLKPNFERFINWINGKTEDKTQKEEALKTNTLFIVGDSIDGIGVYPGQEEELEIKDIKNQYIELGNLLKKIRKEVTIILCPGQHDAVRVAEPQPPIGKEYAPDLHEQKNIILVSNPSLIEIQDQNQKGLFFQLYHGASMHSFVDEIESLRIKKSNEKPSLIVKEMLKRRHLNPTHSSSVYLPSEKEDALLINKTPDVILTGEMHRTDSNEKNNIQIICSSCWQSKTAFEEKVGNNPDPCKVPILNLKTRKIKFLDFT